MAKYRKKPVVVEAVRLALANEESPMDVASWLHEPSRVLQWDSDRDGGLSIITLEGVMRANPGDYVIQGVSGELYPCKPEIFEATYEHVCTGEIGNPDSLQKSRSQFRPD
jgi:hypothetical protein